MSYTSEHWAQGCLKAMGNPNPSPQCINWVASWTNFETSCCGGASYNLLNTTEPNTRGVVSNFNGVGVKNYNSYASGVGANAKVINNGYYNTLAQALKTNNTGLLYSNNAAINQELSVWGTGAVQNSIASAAQNPGSLLSQAFGGNPMSVPTSSGTTNSTGSNLGQKPAGSQTSTAAGGSSLAPQAVACAPFDIGCGLSNFWNVNVLPFLEHMFLFVLALILVILGFYLMGGKGSDLNPVAQVKKVGAALAA